MFDRKGTKFASIHNQVIHIKNHKKMKKLILVLACSALFMVSCKKETENKTNEETMNTTETVANTWEGEYEGTLPCADCEGIKVSLELAADYTFERETVYLGKESDEFDAEGSYSIENGVLTLVDTEGEKEMYELGENKLTLLDAEGNKNEGELAEYYILTKK